MTNQIFVDTLFVVALINRRDQDHAQASALAEKFDGYRLLITHAVLLEIGNALARGFKREAAEIIEHFLAGHPEAEGLTSKSSGKVGLVDRIVRSSLPRRWFSSP